MNPAEVVLLLAAVLLPVALGCLAAVVRRPWWWAALAAIVLAMIAAIAPTPEPGEPRVAAGDLGFLVMVALLVALLTWLGYFLGRRFWVDPRG
jgi:apolipoprotein N-acyltransferase